MSRGARNPRMVKIHRSYSVEEAARQLAVHKNTIREWIKRGLPTIDRQRPTLILGRDLIAFLEQRRKRNKRPCLPGQIYCLRCRCPQEPMDAWVDYLPVTTISGNLVGICPACHARMYRRVSMAKLSEVRGGLDVRMVQAEQHMVGLLMPPTRRSRIIWTRPPREC